MGQNDDELRKRIHDLEIAVAAHVSECRVRQEANRRGFLLMLTLIPVITGVAGVVINKLMQ